MHLDAFRDHALALPGTTEDQPFGPDTLVFRVGPKIFALLALDGDTVNLTCDPEQAVELRERYADVVPGYHVRRRPAQPTRRTGYGPAAGRRAGGRDSRDGWGIVRARPGEPAAGSPRRARTGVGGAA